jgi:hypothetical protein
MDSLSTRIPCNCWTNPCHPKDHRTELVTLLQSWIEDGNPEEQQETGESLIRALDEDRLADRQLFPPELQGVTW